MKYKHIFPITKFAKFARTTRHTLIHYDEFGILSPMSRGDNNYRYYSHTQLATVNLIRTCQALGMSLTEIKDLLERRTPTQMCEVLERKISSIDEIIQEWNRAKKLFDVLGTTIHSLTDIDESAITVQYVEEQPIVLGELNDYRGGRDDYDALSSFYESFIEKYPDMDMNYPVWGTFSEERIKRRDWRWPDRYYFINPDGLDKKPAGLYAIGYKRGGYGESKELYERLLDYIDTHGFEICGPTFEEYPLNEICITDDNNYLIRIMISVRQK